MATPDLIPNSEVKHGRADDTPLGESRSLPHTVYTQQGAGDGTRKGRVARREPRGV